MNNSFFGLKWFKIAVQFAVGFTLLCGGLTVMWAWHVHAFRIIQVIPSAAPMQFNTALCFFLLGVGILASFRTSRLLPLFLSAASVTVSGLSLIQYIINQNFGIDQLFVRSITLPVVTHIGRMAPNTAVCFILSGVALFLMSGKLIPQKRSFLVITMAGIVGGLSIVSLFGYANDFPEAYRWAGLTGMAIHTGFGFLLFSFYLLTNSFVEGHQEQKGLPSWLSVSIGITGFTISFVLWQAVAVNERTQIKHTIQELADNTKNVFDLGITERKNAVLRMANRVAVGGDKSLQLWKADSKNHFSTFPSFRSISLVGSDRRIQTMIFSDRYKQRTSPKLLEQSMQAALSSAAHHQAVSVEPETRGNPGEILIIAAPFIATNSSHGFVVVEMDLPNLFEKLLPLAQFNRSAFVVLGNDQEIFRRNPTGILADSDWAREVPLSISDNVLWKLKLLPLQSYIKQLSSITHWFVLGVGGILTMLMSGFFAMARKATAARAILEIQTVELQALNQNLEAVVGKRNHELAKESSKRARNANQLRLVIEHCPMAIAMFDKNMKYLLASEKWLSDFGLEKHQVQEGCNFYDCFPTLDPHWKERHQRSLLGETLVGKEEFGRRPDGVGEWVHWEIHPWKDGNDVGGIIIFRENITERKEAESKLIRSEKQFKKAIIDSPFPKMLHIEDGEVLLLSRAWTEYSGYSLDDMPTIGHWVKNAYGKRADELRKYIDALFDLETKQHNGEYTIRTKSGDERVWDFWTVPLGRLPDGRRLLLSTASDVTERKKVESQLRLITDALPVLISYIDKDLIYRFNNAAYEKWFRKSKEEIIGKTMVEILGEKAVETLKPHLDKVLSGELVHFETATAYSTGLRTIEATYIPDFDVDKGAKGFYVLVSDISERKRAELALKQSEQDFRELAEQLEVKVKERTKAVEERDEKLHLALKSALTGTWDWTIETNKLNWDSAMCAIFGVSPETFKATLEGFLELLHPEDREPTNKKIQDAVEKDLDYETEYRVIWPDKSIHHIHARGRGFKNKEGTPVRMIGICWDITERKQTEIARLKAEQKFRVVMEAAPDSIILINSLGKISSVNIQAEKLFGYSRDEMIGQDVEMLIPKEVRENHVSLRDHFLRSPGTRRMEKGRELSAVNKEGRLIPVEINLSPGEAEDEFFVMAVVRDVTERKKAETQLRTLAAVVDSSNDFIGICSPDMNPIYVNEAGMRMVGLSSMEEVKKTRMLDYFWPEDRRRIENEAIPILTRTGRWSGVCRFQNFKTGEPIHTMWNAFLIKDASGKPTAWGTVSPNLNLMKESEDKIRAALAEKEALLREIHHRVKNNLNVISSLLGLQAHNVKDANLSEAFRESRNRVVSMALIHEKLYQSQNLAEIDFEQYVKSFVSSLYHSYGINEEQFMAKLDIHDVKFDIDTAIPCSLIINELVSNSLKYAFQRREHGEISIGVHQGHSDENWAYELVVADDGLGMPQDFNIESSSSLGLKLVKTLTRQIDGNLKLDTSHGTKFTIHFGKKNVLREGGHHVN